MDLKKVVFLRATTEAKAYRSIGKGCTKKKKELQRERFMAVYQIIEEAGLKAEYRDWKPVEKE